MPRPRPTRLTKVATLGMLAVVALLSVASFAALRAVASAEARSRKAHQDLAGSTAIRASFEHRVAAARGYLLTGDREFLYRSAGARDAFVERLGSHLRVADGTVKHLLLEIRDLERHHDEALVRLMNERAAGRSPSEIEVPFQSVAPKRQAVLAALRSLAQDREAAAADETQSAAESLAGVRWMLGAISILALISTAGIAGAQIRAARREQQSLARWTEFLSVASHDVKSPLGTLSLQVDTLALLLERQGLREPAVRALLDKMKRQVSAMATLVSDVLDVSRIRLASMPLHIAPVDLVEVATEAIERLSPSFHDEKTSVALRASCPVRGEWDRIRLDQVVVNLLSNALKYGEKRPVEVAVEEAGMVARLTVRDQGAGIPKEAQATIFDRFARASGEHRPGHGLGLWITRAIVAAHKGNIAVESAPGSGATFVVELPKSGAADRAGSPP